MPIHVETVIVTIADLNHVEAMIAVATMIISSFVPDAETMIAMDEAVDNMLMVTNIKHAATNWEIH